MCRYWYKMEKLHHHKMVGREKMIISLFFGDTRSCNFTDGFTLTSYLGIRKNFSKSLNLTKLLTVKKWQELAPSVTTSKNIR